MKSGKRYLAALKEVDRFKEYPVGEAIELVKSNAKAKFDESVEISVTNNIFSTYANNDSLNLILTLTPAEDYIDQVEDSTAIRTGSDE